MFDEEELGYSQVNNKINNKSQEEQTIESPIKKPRSKKANKTPQDEEEDDGDDESYQTQQVQLKQQQLPDYEFFGDFSFAQKIYDLFFAKKLPRFCIIQGKAGIGKEHGINIAISKIFEKHGFVCDLTLEENQPSNPDVLYVRNIQKSGEYDFKNLSKNFITLKDDIEARVKPFVHKTPLMDGCKFIIFDCIDNLSIQVANSLLKTMEEADNNLYIIAISHDVSRVLKTIRSRGIIFNVPPPSIKDFEKILRHQSIETSNIETLYDISGLSPFIAKLFISQNYKNMLEKITLSLTNKKPITLEQVENFTLFCLLCEFAIVKYSIANPAVCETAMDSISNMKHILNDFIIYNTTQELTKISIITAFNNFIKLTVGL